MAGLMVNIEILSFSQCLRGEDSETIPTWSGVETLCWNRGEDQKNLTRTSNQN